MMRTLGEVFTQLTNELRDTHGEARRTRTWYRVTEGLARELRDHTRCCTRVHVNEGDVD